MTTHEKIEEVMMKMERLLETGNALDLADTQELLNELAIIEKELLDKEQWA